MMRRLSNILTLLCVLVLCIECEQYLVSNVETNLISNDSETQFYTEDVETSTSSDEETSPYNRSTRALGDEPIYPKVEKLIIKR